MRIARIIIMFFIVLIPRLNAQNIQFLHLTKEGESLNQILLSYLKPDEIIGPQNDFVKDIYLKNPHISFWGDMTKKRPILLRVPREMIKEKVIKDKINRSVGKVKVLITGKTTLQEEVAKIHGGKKIAKLINLNRKRNKVREDRLLPGRILNIFFYPPLVNPENRDFNSYLTGRLNYVGTVIKPELSAGSFSYDGESLFMKGATLKFSSMIRNRFSFFSLSGQASYEFDSNSEYLMAQTYLTVEKSFFLFSSGLEYDRFSINIPGRIDERISNLFLNIEASKMLQANRIPMSFKLGFGYSLFSEKLDLGTAFFKTINNIKVSGMISINVVAGISIAAEMANYFSSDLNGYRRFNLKIGKLF